MTLIELPGRHPGRGAAGRRHGGGHIKERWRLGRAALGAVVAVAGFCALPLVAEAQDFDRDYLAARQRLVERLKDATGNCVPDALADAGVRALDAMLLGRFGSSLPTVAAKSPVASPTWECTAGGGQTLDGLWLETRDGEGRLVVTTPGLVRAWAARQGPLRDRVGPAGQWADGLPRNGAWYAWGLLSDTRGAIAAEIAVQPRNAGTQALVFLVGESQTDLWDTHPNGLLAVVATKDRVTIALMPVTAFANREACRAGLEPLERREAPEGETLAAFARCWTAVLEMSPRKPALAKAAQDLVEALEVQGK